MLMIRKTNHSDPIDLLIPDLIYSLALLIICLWLRKLAMKQ